MVKLKPKNLHYYNNIRKCCLGVSLHSHNHTGEKLATIIEYINDNFETCLIDLSDTLYAYHYMSTEGLSRAEAHCIAASEGDKWLANNADIIQKLKIPYEIVRWDTWLNHVDFKDLKNEYFALFDTNKIFRDALLQDIHNYYDRRHNKDVRNVPVKFLKGSISYLLEEITCHTLLARDISCVNVYPGKQLECFKVIREGLVDNAPRGLETFGHIRLNLYEVADTQESQVA